MESSVTPARHGRRSPSVAAFLSFVWPGFGQLYAGQRLVAAAFAAPAAIALLLLLWQARRGAAVFAASMLVSGFALAMLVLFVLIGLWRAVAVGHAYVSTGDRRSRRSVRGQAALGLLFGAILVMHSFGAYLAYAAYDADQHIFSNENFAFGGEPTQSGSATGSPGATSAPGTPLPTLEPAETPPPNSNRVTILMTGIDSYVGRAEKLNDTLLVVTIDKATRKVAMLSVPRDTAGFPLYWGGKVAPTLKINALVTYVKNGWIKSPDEPMTTLVKELSYLIGIPINYYAMIDLAGFARMIDAVGGVDVNNPAPINDPKYDWLDHSPAGFSLSAGRHHLNGRLALAYVRSRQGIGDSDYTRSSRQQEVLVALEHKMSDPAMLVRLPDLMRMAGSMIRTNFPADQVADMVAVGEEVPASAIARYVLGSPYSLGNATRSLGVWTSCLRLDRVAKLSVDLFGQDSRYYGKTQPMTCAS